MFRNFIPSSFPGASRGVTICAAVVLMAGLLARDSAAQTYR